MNTLFLTMLALSTTDLPQANDAIAALRTLPVSRTALERCLSQNMISLGQNSAEPAEGLMRAARSLCQAEDDTLRKTYDRMPLPPRHSTGLLERDRRVAEDAAIAALLLARTRP